MRKLFKVKKPGGGEYPEWCFRYLDEYSELKFAKGSTDRQATLKKQRETLSIVDRKKAALEAGERVKTDEKLSTLVSMHLAWGRDQGRKGRPWSSKHLENATRDLTWWTETLGDRPLAAVSLPDVEGALIARRKAGRGGIPQAADFFRTFLRWAIQRHFRAGLPPEEVPKYDKTVKNPFRNLTLAELCKLFAVVSRARSINYRVALITGARRGEMGSRKVEHMDWVANILTLESGSAKNRKAFRFWLPDDLVADMAEACKNKGPGDPLFDALSSSHAARALKLECRKAGIPIQTQDGRITFHSLRVTFITELFGTGADPKTVMELARHGDPRLTFRTYAKMRPEALRGSLRTLDSRLLAAIEGRQKTDKTPEGEVLGPALVLGEKWSGRQDSKQAPTPHDILASTAQAQRNEISILPPVGPQVQRILAQSEATKKRQKILERLAFIAEALSEDGLASLLQRAELLAGNEAATARRRPA